MTAADETAQRMIQQVSLRPAPASGRRSPVIGRRSPLADVLGSDPVLAAMLRDLDIALVFPFLDLPAKAIRTPVADLLPDVDEAAIDRLRAGRAYLVLDHSSEGPRHRPDFSRLLHDWCELHAVSPSALIYVTANRAWAEQYSAWCEEQALAERYTHIFFDAYVEEIAAAGAGLERAPTESQLMHADPRPHRFLNFNNAPRPERILVAAHMLAATPSDSLVSLGSGKGRATADRSLEQIARRYRTGRFLEKHPALFEQLDFERLQSQATLGAPDAAADVPLYKRFDLDHYADSYVSVVTESEMSGGQVQRITEKIVKPFLFGHLAVVAGNPGALAFVRELGFQTFDPLIDESYDAIADPNERLCAVLCEVDRLRSLSDEAMHRLFMELEEVRRANLGYGRDVLTHRVRFDARTTVAGHLLERARVTIRRT